MNREDRILDLENNAEKSSESNKDNKKAQSNSVLKEILNWILTFSIAILVAVVLKEFVIINATVPTGSMENTILPGDDLFGFRLAYTFSEPERGDIVIFKNPDDRSEKYIKRLIGLPGDKVEIVDAQVYINGELLEEDYLKEAWVSGTGPYEFNVPEGHYYFMGDNRNDSLDARYWANTYVPKDDLIGKALAIYYPFDRIGILKED